MTLTREEVERALIPAVKRGAMVSLTAGTVTGPRHVDGQIVDGPTGPVGQEGYVLNVDGHRYWLPYDGTAPTQVPWTIPNRHVTIGPDGDQQPALELIRDRPTGRHSALMYLALGTAPELAWLLRDGDTALVTLRLTKDGLRLQNNVAGTTRYFAFDDDTGWLPLTPLSGFTGSPQYRRANGKTELSGRVTRTAGSWPTGTYTVFANLPAIARPAALRTLSVNDRAGRNYLLAAYPNGDLAVHPGQSATRSAEAELDSVNHFR